MTTTFENETSKAVERAVLAILKRAWGLDRERKLPDFEAADYAIEKRDGEQMLIEVKSQTRKYLDELVVKTGEKKLTALEVLARRYGVKAVIVFPMLVDRSVWWIELEQARKVERRFFGGRAPRPGSANDQEMMVAIPIGALNGFSGEWLDGGVADAAIAYNIEHRNG